MHKLPLLIVLAFAVSACHRQQASPDLSPQALEEKSDDPTKPPQFGPLGAGTLIQVQGVGQAILAAKHSVQPSAEEKALEAELQGLSADIDGLLQMHPSTASVRFGPPTAGPVEQKSATTLNLSPRLERLRQRSQALQKLANSDGAIGLDPSRAEQLAASVADIEQSVQAALALPEQKRFVALVALRDKLQPKTLGQLQTEQASASGTLPQSQPTLTTIVEHRSAQSQ